MAVGEARKQVTAAKGGNIISQVSWTDGVAQDMYYGLDHSFQYSSNINTDDELHGIKLSNRADYLPGYFNKCQLISLGEHGVMALPIDTRTAGDEVLLKRFQYNGHYDSNGNELPDGPSSTSGTKWTMLNQSAGSTYSYKYDTVRGVVFQDKLWFASNRVDTTSNPNVNYGYIASVPCALETAAQADDQMTYLPYDHNDYTDESIEDASDTTGLFMQGSITAVLNYNNTRLVVAAGQDIWVYYPELDDGDKHGTQYYGQTGWKRVLHYEAGVTVVALTCTFEYLKVRAVDEGWNTKVYYYQGNNNLRSTFVYNLVDLTGVRVLHVYSINGVDYYTSSIDGSDGLIDLNKMVGATPVKLFTQRAGLTVYDTNYKAPYFVGPTSISGDYNNGGIYIADAYGIFKFNYNPQGYDKGYMKWQLRDTITSGKQVYGMCINKGFLYISDSDGCRAMRLYDTGVDGYQEKGVLISRQFEGREGGTATKMLDEIRMNFELNPLTNYNGDIDIYISPNNLWRDTDIVDYQYEGTVNDWEDLPQTANKNEYYLVKNKHEGTPEFPAKTYVVWKRVSGVWEWAVRGSEAPSLEDDGWYKVMHIDQRNGKTRAEKSNILNDMGKKDGSSFKFDWQTITYAIVITRGDEQKATPIVRELNIRYHCKDKTNNVYDIN